MGQFCLRQDDKQAPALSWTSLTARSELLCGMGSRLVEHMSPERRRSLLKMPAKVHYVACISDSFRSDSECLPSDLSKLA